MPLNREPSRMKAVWVKGRSWVGVQAVARGVVDRKSWRAVRDENAVQLSSRYIVEKEQGRSRQVLDPADQICFRGLHAKEPLLHAFTERRRRAEEDEPAH
eukprot:126358-Prymnesium_polylepis.1